MGGWDKKKKKNFFKKNNKKIWVGAIFPGRSGHSKQIFFIVVLIIPVQRAPLFWKGTTLWSAMGQNVKKKTPHHSMQIFANFELGPHPGCDAIYWTLVNLFIDTKVYW